MTNSEFLADIQGKQFKIKDGIDSTQFIVKEPFKFSDAYWVHVCFNLVSGADAMHCQITPFDDCIIAEANLLGKRVHLKLQQSDFILL